MPSNPVEALAVGKALSDIQQERGFTCHLDEKTSDQWILYAYKACTQRIVFSLILLIDGIKWLRFLE